MTHNAPNPLGHQHTKHIRLLHVAGQSIELFLQPRLKPSNELRDSLVVPQKVCHLAIDHPQPSLRALPDLMRPGIDPYVLPGLVNNQRNGGVRDLVLDGGSGDARGLLGRIHDVFGGWVGLGGPACGEIPGCERQSGCLRGVSVVRLTSTDGTIRVNALEEQRVTMLEQGDLLDRGIGPVEEPGEQDYQS